MPVYDGDLIVGTTRRTAWSRTFGRGIAVALINRDHSQTGKMLTLPHGSGVTEVEVTHLPFVESKFKPKVATKSDL